MVNPSMLTYKIREAKIILLELSLNIYSKCPYLTGKKF